MFRKRRATSRERTRRRHLLQSLKTASSKSLLVNRLPPELHLMVADHLPLSSIAALALTNRHMYEAMQRKAVWTQLRRKENSKDRFELLKLFDVKHPHDVLCEVCTVFHPRESHLGSEVFQCFDWYKQYHELSTISLDFAMQRIEWITAHLVMRSHRHSPVHGLPRRTLEFDAVPRNDSSSWIVDRRAVIVDNKLLIRQRHFSGFTPTNPDSLKLEPTGCAHYRNLDTMFQLVLHQACQQDLQQKVVETETYRCPDCPTELLIGACKHEDFPCKATSLISQPYLLVVERYVDLGDCSSPGSGEWHLLSSEPETKSATDLDTNPDANSENIPNPLPHLAKPRIRDRFYSAATRLDG